MSVNYGIIFKTSYRAIGEVNLLFLNPFDGLLTTRVHCWLAMGEKRLFVHSICEGIQW